MGIRVSEVSEGVVEAGASEAKAKAAAEVDCKQTGEWTTKTEAEKATSAADAHDLV